VKGKCEVFSFFFSFVLFFSFLSLDSLFSLFLSSSLDQLRHVHEGIVLKMMRMREDGERKREEEDDGARKKKKKFKRKHSLLALFVKYHFHHD